MIRLVSRHTFYTQILNDVQPSRRWDRLYQISQVSMDDIPLGASQNWNPSDTIPLRDFVNAPE